MTAPGPAIDSITIHRVRLDLARPWVSPVAAFTQRDVVLVEVVVEGVSGWGECTAQPEPTYTSEYVDGAVDVLARHLVPRALAVPGGAATGVPAALAPVKGHPMARTALTTAVIDALLRLAGVRLVDHLAGWAQTITAGWRAPATVPGGVVIGVADDLGALVAECEERVGEGYRRLKLKVRPGWDVDPVAAVRAAVGPDIALQVDANGSYATKTANAEAAEVLAGLAPYDLLCVEQPLADDDLVGHAALARSLPVAVCLDESITSPDTAASAIALGACDVVTVKPGRVGGLLDAVAIHDRCRRAGVPVWCGGMLETGVGRAANLALAALPGFTLPGDLSAAARYWHDDVVDAPAVLRPDGTIAVPTGPGIGVEVRADLPDRTVWSRRWARTR